MIGLVSLKDQGIELLFNTQFDKGRHPPERDLSRQAARQDSTPYFGGSNIDEAVAYSNDTGLHSSEPQLTGYGWAAIHFFYFNGDAICPHGLLSMREKQ